MRALKLLPFVFGYGIPLWGCKLSPLYLWSAHLYFRFIFHRMLYSQWKWISYCSRYVYSFEVCPTKCLLYIFGYGFLRWRWKFSGVIWGMCKLYFRFIIDDMLHSQCKLISNWSRYVHSFNVCTLKYSVFTFGYGILGWRWKCSSPYLKYTYFYTFPLFFDDILYSQWLLILTCARYVYSFVYIHSNFYFLFLVMIFYVDDGSGRHAI